MSQPNRPRSQVRGPSSALSSFLRERGIRVPTNPYRRLDGNRQQQNQTEQTPSVEQGTDQTPSAEQTQEEARSQENRVQQAKGRKRAKKKDDSDDEDQMPFSKRSKHSKKKQVPEDISELVRFCARCKRRFLYGTQGSDTVLCHACTTVKGKQSNLQKRVRKKAEDVVLQFTGGLNGTILPLRDMCLNLISECIDQVDQLGWIEPETRLKFAKIISRRRQLNNQTVSLFLGPDEDQVQLFDCTYLDENGLSQIPMQCPNLITLDLELCGRMTDTVLGLIGDRCSGLINLSLGGAFLPSSKSWIDLFPKLPNLKSLRLQFAAKITNDAVKTLTEACPLLEELELDDCGLVDNHGVVSLQNLKHLRQLSLNCIGQVDVNVLGELLAVVGPQLSKLSLNRQNSLEDSILPIIEKCCSNLAHLSLQNCALVTANTASMVKMLTNLPPLTTLDLAGNNCIEDNVVCCIANIHGPNLENLNLNGLDELTTTSFNLLVNKLPSLLHADFSWIRVLDDPLFLKLMESSPKLQSIKVFGCNQLSEPTLNKESYNEKSRRVIIQGNEFD